MIALNGHDRYLGSYETPNMAAMAYDVTLRENNVFDSTKLNYCWENSTKKKKKKIKEKKKRKKKRKKATSFTRVKYKGVWKSGARYHANITLGGERRSLGTFDTPRQAAEAYDRAAIQELRPSTSLNFTNQIPMNYDRYQKSFLKNDSSSSVDDELSFFNNIEEKSKSFQHQTNEDNQSLTRSDQSFHGERGVSKSGSKKFMANIYVEGEKKYLGEMILFFFSSKFTII